MNHLGRRHQNLDPADWKYVYRHQRILILHKWCFPVKNGIFRYDKNGVTGRWADNKILFVCPLPTYQQFTSGLPESLKSFFLGSKKLSDLLCSER